MKSGEIWEYVDKGEDPQHSIRLKYREPRHETGSIYTWLCAVITHWNGEDTYVYDSYLSSDTILKDYKKVSE